MERRAAVTALSKLARHIDCFFDITTSKQLETELPQVNERIDLAVRGQRLREALRSAPRAARTILGAPVARLGKALDRFQMKIAGTELARALERIKKELDEKWDEGNKPLAKLANDLKNTPDDELLELDSGPALNEGRGTSNELARRSPHAPH
jgi:hypothetical protein